MIGSGDRAEAGINVVGHLTSASGLGNTTRLFIDVLRQSGLRVAGFDIEPYAAKEIPPLADGMLKTHVEQLPFNHNLVIASIDRLPQLWLRHAAGLLLPRFRNAGLLFWELPTIPDAWLPSLQMFDAVLACSGFVRQAFETAVPDVPTVFAEHPLKQLHCDHDRGALRRRWGIPTDATAYCCGFDLVSGLSRKNPMGSISAWKRAFPSDADVCLVIKLSGNVLANTHFNTHVQSFLAEIKGDKRIILVNEWLSDTDLIALYDCCDVFVSLHRSEGLGLIPMEAMSLGKVVVATGFSGNMTFMNEQNSLPVPYRLIEPMQDRAFLSRKFAGRTASWADPDVEWAAAALRSAKRPDVAIRLGACAKADIARRQEAAWKGTFIEQMTKYLSDSTRVALRPALRRRILAREILDPTLLRKNLMSVLKISRN